jgi:hypothetical protein
MASLQGTGTAALAVVRRVLKSWPLLLALMVFTPLGFVAGFNVRQASLTMSSTATLLKETRDLRNFLLTAEATQARNLDDKIAALDKASASTAALVAKTSTASQNAALSDSLGAVTVASTTLHKAIDSENLAYFRKINADLVGLQSIEERVRNQAEASSDWQSIYYDQFKRFLKWIGAVSFLTIMAIALFSLALCNPGFRKIIARTGTISAFGVSINLSDLQSVRASVTTRELQIETDVKSIYARTLRDSGLAAEFLRLMRQVEVIFKSNGVDLKQRKYRATLFVPGFVGQELVQATRYDGNDRVGDESKIGRRFSVRYGIIGKAWRLQTCLYYPNVQNTNNNLVRDWGFTGEEAKPYSASMPTGPSASLMAFSVSDVGDAPPLGVIYIEAEGGDQLHPANHVAKLSIDDPDKNGRSSADRFAYNEIWAKLDDAVKENLRKRLSRLQKLMQWNDKIQEGAGR